MANINLSHSQKMRLSQMAKSVRWYEMLLNRNAKINMKNWDLENFKKSHPSLFQTIIASMAEVEYYVEIEKDKFPNKID